MKLCHFITIKTKLLQIFDKIWCSTGECKLSAKAFNVSLATMASFLQISYLALADSLHSPVEHQILLKILLTPGEETIRIFSRINASINTY